jgi:hypothetical protein
MTVAAGRGVPDAGDARPLVDPSVFPPCWATTSEDTGTAAVRHP